MLAGDTFSNTVLQRYSSVTARFNISIDNSAWFPDPAAAVNVTHKQLVDGLRSLGYSVVCPYSLTSPDYGAQGMHLQRETGQAGTHQEQ